MTDEADHLLLQEWISSWEAACWDTKILSLADAKQHADYDMFAAQLQLIPLMGEDGLGNNVFYNQVCIYYLIKNQTNNHTCSVCCVRSVLRVCHFGVVVLLD